MLNNIRNLWPSSLVFIVSRKDHHKIILLALLTLLIVNVAAPIPAYAGQTLLASNYPLVERAGQIDIQLDQALVLEGGESTNPRDYDPATTFSGGEKRVFSGLVSFDPQLNLTADLADRW